MIKMPDSNSDLRVICLDQFLKLHGLVETGGEAKLTIQAGQVRLNGVVETRRRKKLSLEIWSNSAGNVTRFDFLTS